MAFIMIENLPEKAFHVSDQAKTLLEHFQDHGIDWMHACGGKGRCTTCRVIVKHGHENFSEATPAELGYLRQGALLRHERLSCQATILGDVCIEVPKETQLPHIRYSPAQEPPGAA